MSNKADDRPIYDNFTQSVSNRELQVALGIAVLTLSVVGAISYRGTGVSDESYRWIRHTLEVFAISSAHSSRDSLLRREIIKVSVELLNCRPFGGCYFFRDNRKVC
jgi:hypothetical protein